jgi:hypothetical protein
LPKSTDWRQGRHVEFEPEIVARVADCPPDLRIEHMIRTGLTLLAILIPCTATAAEPPDEAQILTWLRELEPLPKVHYSWPLPWSSISDDLLTEYVRLTHAASVSGEWHNRDEIDRAVRTCQQVNAADSEIKASIGVNYSVWHRRFGKDLPPTDTGPTQDAELEYLRSRLQSIRDEVAAANQRHGADVSVSAVLFDSERFHTRGDDAEWNRALTAKYDAAYDVAREVLSGVRIEWYARGAVQPSASATGWSTSNYFTLDEQGESFGCSLYRVPEIGYTRETFRRTAALAAEHGCEQVTPWIALASGYRRQVDAFHKWSLDWDYDLIYSWQLGAEINQPWFGAPERQERFAPWNKAQIAIFYPEPFGRTPYWGVHFVAYVRGAQLIRSLPESEPAAGGGE